jgi:quaternary ammonium compound-resistance protein SugE
MLSAMTSSTITAAWSMLLVAGLLEIIWASGLKFTHGWTKLWPSLGVGLAMVASMVLLSRAMQHLPAGTAYAVWVGIGAVGTAVVGMIWMGEPVTAARIGFIAMIAVGIIGLKLVSTGAGV